jgi:hypothetical protein
MRYNSDRHNAPAIHLRVDLDSRVDDREEVGHWWTTCWPDLGEWFKPGYPNPSNSLNPMAFSHDWTEPSRNDATGKWEREAVVCSWINRPLSNKNDAKFHEPYFNLRVLRTNFSLEMKHSVAGHSVNIILTKAPWTSGIYRRAECASDADQSLTSPIPAPVAQRTLPSMLPPPYRPD